jgi:hypothetical protein
LEGLTGGGLGGGGSVFAGTAGRVQPANRVRRRTIHGKIFRFIFIFLMIDGLIKSVQIMFTVIPAKAGIQFFSIC